MLIFINAPDGLLRRRLGTVIALEEGMSQQVRSDHCCRPTTIQRSVARLPQIVRVFNVRLLYRWLVTQPAALDRC